MLAPSRQAGVKTAALHARRRVLKDPTRRTRRFQRSVHTKVTISQAPHLFEVRIATRLTLQIAEKVGRINGGSIGSLRQGCA